MQLFYNPDLNTKVTEFSFDAEESKHITKVLRKKEGDIIHITNGQGHVFTAQLLTSNSKKCTVEILSSERKHKKMHSLHMVVAPTKNNTRYAWFLEKATEIGINEITPIMCDHSERSTLKIDRMQKVLQSAMKQSLRYYIPTLNELISFEDFIKEERSGLKFIAHCAEDEKRELKRCVAADRDVTILIGPEGDFSRSEIQTAYDHGYMPVSLGEFRLRTETAALVSCTIVNLINSS